MKTFAFSLTAVFAPTLYVLISTNPQDGNTLPDSRSGLYVTNDKSVFLEPAGLEGRMIATAMLPENACLYLINSSPSKGALAHIAAISAHDGILEPHVGWTEKKNLIPASMERTRDCRAELGPILSY